MAGVGGGLVYSNFDSASAEMDPDHPFGTSRREDALSTQHSSPHHQAEDQQHLSGYLTSEGASSVYDLNSNYTDGDQEIWANATEQCWWNGTNSTIICEPIGDTEIDYSLGFKVIIAILYNSIFVAALLGNALVCYVVFSSPRMRTVTNYLIANLAVGDLLMGVLCVPFSYIIVLLQYWPFGHFLCILLCPAQAISVLVSSYTLVALAADRYMAILYPLRPRFRRSQACWVIAVVWLIAIITASPIAIFTEYYTRNDTGLYYCEETGWTTMGAENFKLPYGLTLMILQYFFPLVVLIFTYSRIAMAVWGKKSLGEAEDSRDQRLAKTKRKTVVMSLAVVTGYTLAWLPLNIFVLVGPERILWYPEYVFFACHSLAMAHTTYNPIIYAWMNMIKMMLTVVIVYTISWLPLNIFLIYGDIWHDNLYLENSVVVSYIYPVIHLPAMAHSVWNPVIYCYMNSRFREGFRAAISNVPCIRKIMRFCQLPKSRRSRSSGTMTESTRCRMSYYSQSGNTRLTRTNTTNTTYTFGSGSLHNIHNTSTNPAVYPHQPHHNYAMNNALVMGKHSYLPVSNGNDSLNLNRRGSQRPSITSASILVSPYPKPNQLSISSGSAASMGGGGGKAPENIDNGTGNFTLNKSSTMTSLTPGLSSSLESSPSSLGHTIDSGHNGSSSGIPMSCLKNKSNGTDLINSCSQNNDRNGKKKVSLKTVARNDNGTTTSPKSSSPVIKNSSSYVSIFSKGGKEVVTTKAIAAKGKTVKKKSSTSAAGSTKSSSSSNGGRSFLNRKRSSTSSGVSESFM